MRKITFKSLLVTAALCLGTSAWAQTTYYSQDYEAADATADWTTGTGSRYTPVLLTENENTYLSVNQGERNNNGTTLTSTSLVDKVAAGTDFTMIFDMKISSSTNQSPTSFVVNDAENSSAILSIVATGTWATSWKVNDNITVTLDGTNKGNSTQTIADVPWYTFKLTRNGEYTYLTITATSSETVVLERTLITTLSSTGGLGNMKFNSSRYLANFAIDNIVVRSIEDGDVPEAVATTYTIKYVDVNGMDIIDPVVENTLAGENVTAPITPIYDANGVKYIYKSGTNTIEAKEDASENIITLTYEEATAYNYSLKAVDDEQNELKVLNTGVVYEGDTKKVYYSKGIIVDGQWYLAKANASEPYYGVNINSEGDVYVTYEASDIAYFFENSDLTLTRSWAAQGAVPNRYSNGDAGRIYANAYAYTPELAAGTYTVTVCGRNQRSGGTGNIYLYLRDSEGVYTALENVFEDWQAAAQGEKSSTDVVIPEGYSLAIWAGEYNSNIELDYLYLTKTAETVSVTEAGYATFSSAYAVDFSAEEGLTAYTAKVNDGNATITLTAIEDGIVPANTGVILKGEAGDYTGAITTTEATVDNDLKANATEITGNGSIYVLNNGTKGIGFYQLSETGTLAAGKAYLEITSSAKAYTFVWNESTGIEENYEFGTMSSDAATYDLSGRKVANPAKGLYIKNGKKFIVK